MPECRCSRVYVGHRLDLCSSIQFRRANHAACQRPALPQSFARR